MYTVFSKNQELQIPDSEWEKFCSSYKIVEAAGGLVQNSRGEYLMIFRNGKWDLPKGKHEKGESMEETALREVEEECNLDRLTLQKKLIVTHHTYVLQGIDILKPTHWYTMMYDGEKSVFRPQTEEGIEVAQFMTTEEILSECFSNCYDSIRAVFAAAGIQ